MSDSTDRYQARTTGRWWRYRPGRGGLGRVVDVPELPTTVGSVTLRNPVMTASGTAGHGAELSPYVDLAGLGAVVTKSVHADPWPDNPPPPLPRR